MENIELLKDKKTQNNQGEISSDIFDNFSKKIDVQKLIDNGILKISDDVKKHIDNIGYSIEDVLKLAFIYKSFDSLLDINIHISDIGNFGISIKSLGKLFSLEVTVYPFSKAIHDESMNVRLTSEVSGFKLFFEQVIFAKFNGYKYIHGFPGRELTLDGYAYWPRIGFRADPDINISDLVIKSDNIQINDCKTLNELFDLKDVDGNYIGISFWKEYGFGFNAKFDLTEGAKSLKRLNEYILSKKQSNPEKYNDIDVIK